MTPETSQQVLHAIGKGVAAIRAEHADAEDRVRCLEIDGRSDLNAINRLKDQVDGLTEHRDKLLKDRTAASARAGEWEAKFSDRDAAFQKLMRQYDSITLRLYNLMVDLAGHANTGKTRAERVSLGHVVARLAEIRPPVSAAEAAELGLPWNDEAIA
jgi:chromosome segregation ATPase